MANYNKVILIGHLTRDVDVATYGYITVAKTGIAVNSGSKENKQVMFIDINGFNKTAEFLGTYFTKGDAILIEGRLNFETWEKDGKKGSRHTVIVDKAGFVSGKKDEEAEFYKFERKEIKEDTEDTVIKEEDVPF